MRKVRAASSGCGICTVDFAHIYIFIFLVCHCVSALCAANGGFSRENYNAIDKSENAPGF
jgi:hypothetical protein